MRRSQVTVDLRALARNVERLRETVAPAELWAVVKADAYGHGARTSRSQLSKPAPPASAWRPSGRERLRPLVPRNAILAMGPLGEGDGDRARGRARGRPRPAATSPGVPVHLKIETGMGRFGDVGRGGARRSPRRGRRGS